MNVREAVYQYLGGKAPDGVLSDDLTLKDLDLDSYDLVELVLEVEDAIGKAYGDGEFSAIRASDTIGEAIEKLEGGIDG